MQNLRTRLTIAAVSALGGLLVLPAAGQAATNFGSRLLNDPTENTCEKVAQTCTMVSYIHPIDPEGDPYSGGAPVDGVITKFRARAYAVMTPGTITFRVADISLPDPNNNDSALASAKGTGPTMTIVPDESPETKITEIGGRLPVSKGQHLAVDASQSIGIIYNSNGNTYSYLFAPPLVEGAGPRGSTEGINELLVAATIEPDADKDGFGDETQDRCPRQATTQGDCDDTKPGVQGLKVDGDKISYTLTEAATVSLLLEKKSPGRKVGKKCVKQTPKNKAKKRCSKFKPIGAAFAGGGQVGVNTVTLPNGKKLKPGSYRLTLTARDAAGNETTATTTFVVKKKKGKKGKK
jgi:hypothetical protein